MSSKPRHKAVAKGINGRAPKPRAKRPRFVAEPHHPEFLAELLVQRGAFDWFSAVSREDIRAVTGMGFNELLDSDQLSVEGLCIIPEIDVFGIMRGCSITSDPDLVDGASRRFFQIANDFMVRANRMRARANVMRTAKNAEFARQCSIGNVDQAKPLTWRESLARVPDQSVRAAERALDEFVDEAGLHVPRVHKREELSQWKPIRRLANRKADGAQNGASDGAAVKSGR